MFAMCVNNIKYSVYFSNRRKHNLRSLPILISYLFVFFIFDPITLVYAGAWSYNAICIYGFDKKCF